MQQAQAKGFTLIELIVVIVILGILAAVAIPRFINQTKSTRGAALNGLAGALSSAAALAQAQYRADGNSSSSTITSVSMDGTTVTVLAGSGFPDSVVGGIGAAARVTGFTPTYAGTNSTATYILTGVTQDNCNVVYTASTGTAVATTTGC